MASDEDDRNESRGAAYLRRSTALLWDAQEPPTRGPKPGLTLGRIVEVAIEVADAEGIEGLSMRKVAAQLGVGTMSLYRYVPGKAELLDLMLDRVSGPGEGRPSGRELGWRAAMTEIARRGRALYLAHPWLLRANWTRPVFGPNSLADFDRSIAALDGTGLRSRERVHVMMLLDSYVTGSVRQQLLYASAADETGISDEEFWALQYPVLERAMRTGDYPALAALDEDAFEGGWDETFEFGLERLLAGLEALITSRVRGGASRSEPPEAADRP